jgi:hypothetical protein
MTVEIEIVKCSLIRCGLHRSNSRSPSNDESQLPSTLGPARQNPEELFWYFESRLQILCLQDRDLLTQGQILKQQFVA